MKRLPDDIRGLIDGEKTLGAPPAWDERSDPRYFTFLAPLSVGDITTGGFELRACISKRHVNRDAMLQLEYAPAGRRSATELHRLDWRRDHVHTNRAFPREYAFATIAGSHEHAFDDNYIEEEGRMRIRSSLPAARPIMSDPQALSDFIAMCGNRLRIKDIELISLPEITPDLFWNDNGG